MLLSERTLAVAMPGCSTRFIMFSRIKVRDDILDWKDGIDEMYASINIALDKSSIFNHVHVGRLKHNSFQHKLEYEIHEQLEAQFGNETLDGGFVIFNAIVAFVMDNERREVTGFIGRALESNSTSSVNDTETMSLPHPKRITHTHIFHMFVHIV